MRNKKCLNMHQAFHMPSFPPRGCTSAPFGHVHLRIKNRKCTVALICLVGAAYCITFAPQSPQGTKDMPVVIMLIFCKLPTGTRSELLRRWTPLKFDTGLQAPSSYRRGYLLHLPLIVCIEKLWPEWYSWAVIFLTVGSVPVKTKPVYICQWWHTAFGTLPQHNLNSTIGQTKRANR